MFFSPIKEINNLLKDINKLLSRGISNVYLKVIIEKKWYNLKLNLEVKKVRLQVSFGGTPAHAVINQFSNFLLQLKNQRFGSKTVCGFSVIFILKGIMTFWLEKNSRKQKRVQFF